MSNDLEDIDVRQFKLSNSEDLVALVTAKNDKYIMVERPAVVYCTSDGRFKLEPWFQLSSHGSFKINRDQIISSAVVDNDIKETYIKFATYVTQSIDMDETDYADNDYELTHDIDLTKIH